MRLAFGLLVLAMTASGALACEFDTDCQVESRCVKSRGGLYGICAGGLFPGNSNDRVPVRDPFDINRTVGILVRLTPIVDREAAAQRVSAPSTGCACVVGDALKGRCSRRRPGSCTTSGAR
jgi:hypothetical protein